MKADTAGTRVYYSFRRRVLLPPPPPVLHTCCQARPRPQSYPCCKPWRAHGLDTCSLGLGRVFNHRFSRREICPPSRIEMRKACRQIHHCRLSALRQVRSTCRRKLAGNRSHFSTMAQSWVAEAEHWRDVYPRLSGHAAFRCGRRLGAVYLRISEGP
ncbi:hypothetical protein V8C42DRAFT_233219 [Trichoderma barbatum]